MFGHSKRLQSSTDLGRQRLDRRVQNGNAGDSNYRTVRRIRNAVKYFRAIQAKSEISSNYPPIVVFETTASCNLRCAKCPVGRERREDPVPAQMNFELYRRLIDEIKEHSFGVALSGWGEPLTDSRIFEFVNHAKHAGLNVGFFSNGVALDERAIAHIIENRVDWIYFSVDSLPSHSEAYALLKGIPESSAKTHLGRVISNIEHLLDARNIAGSCLEIGCVKLEVPGSTPLAEYRTFWKERGVKVLSGGLSDLAGTVDRIPGTIVESAQQCTALYGLVVNAAGRVPLCCFDYNCQHEIGDTRHQSLHDIYNGEAAQRMRRDYYARPRVDMLCKRCKSPFVAPTSCALVMAAKLWAHNSQVVRTIRHEVRRLSRLPGRDNSIHHAVG